MKKPDAILTADWHLRHDTPICRTDANFVSTMFTKVLWVKRQQEKYGCPVLNAGDMFNKWNVPHWIVSKTIRMLPKQFYTVFGNHELPQHSLSKMEESALWTLVEGGQVKLLKGHFGEKNPEGIEIKGRRILMLHVYTYVGAEPWPGCTHPKAHMLLHKYKDYDLIVTGDNHQSFTQKAPGNRLLVNPGSLMRQEAGQMDFEPKVWFWYADSNTAKPVVVPHQKGVVTREHLESENELNEQITAFISRINTDWEKSLSFEENVDRFFNTNRVRREVKEIVYKML